MCVPGGPCEPASPCNLSSVLPENSAIPCLLPPCQRHSPGCCHGPRPRCGELLILVFAEPKALVCAFQKRREVKHQDASSLTVRHKDKMPGHRLKFPLSQPGKLKGAHYRMVS